MLRFSARPANATFCAMRSTILEIAISITGPSCAAAIFRSRFQLPAIVPHSRNASASSSKCNSVRNIPIGYENWLRPVRICFLRTWIRSVANPCYTPEFASPNSVLPQAVGIRPRGPPISPVAVWSWRCQAPVRRQEHHSFGSPGQNGDLPKNRQHLRKRPLRCVAERSLCGHRHRLWFIPLQPPKTARGVHPLSATPA